MTFIEGTVAACLAAWVLYVLICVRDMMTCYPEPDEEDPEAAEEPTHPVV